MRLFGFRTAFIALIAMVGASLSSVAHADSGTVRLSVIKGGWFVGASGGSGTLTFHRRQYPLSIGGLSAGFLFGASQTYLFGQVSNIRSAYDVAGTYGAVGAGAAIGVGARFIQLRNEKGALMQLYGQQVGLMVNADLSGLQISVPAYQPAYYGRRCYRAYNERGVLRRHCRYYR